MKQGSYVVCIDDSNWDQLAYVYMSDLPVKGKVYRVRRVIHNFSILCEGDGIALEGIYGDWRTFQTNNNTRVFEEYHFRMDRFREIDAPIIDEAFAETKELQADFVVK